MPSLPPSSHRNLQRTSNRSNPYELRRKNDEGLKRGEIRSGGRWQKCRNIYMSKRPMCEDPHQIHERTRYEEAATEVHHIIRLQDGPEHAFNFDNLAALCSHCHAKISAAERKHNRSCLEYFKERKAKFIRMLGEERYNKFMENTKE